VLKKFLITIALCIFVSPAFAADPEATCEVWPAGADDDRCYMPSVACAGDWQCDSGHCNILAGGYCSCEGCGEGGELVHCDPNTYWNGSSCVTCPAWGTVSGKSTGGDQAPAITGCYIKANSATSFSDSTGSGNQKFTSNCYYSN